MPGWCGRKSTGGARRSCHGNVWRGRYFDLQPYRRVLVGAVQVAQRVLEEGGQQPCKATVVPVVAGESVAWSCAFRVGALCCRPWLHLWLDFLCLRLPRFRLLRFRPLL